MPGTDETATFRAVTITWYPDQKPYPTELHDSRLQYIGYGIEHCPTTGREHGQMYAYGKKMKFATWRKLFEPFHIERMRGSIEDNDAYCSKENSMIHIGEKPMKNGHHRSMLQIKRKLDAIEPGETVYDIAKDEELFDHMAKISRFAKEYAENVRKHQIRGDHSAPDVVYIHGPPGAGKTRYVREREPHVYDVPAGDGYKWKDGYALDAAVLFDNVEPRQIKDYSQFLKEIDRYPIQVPIKGGFVWWKPRRIYITSVCAPSIMKTYFRDPEEFTRRITSVVRMDGI